MKTRNCVIVGTGAAGMSAGAEFLDATADGRNDAEGSVTAIGLKLGNSALSPWNIRDPSAPNLAEKIREGGRGCCDDATVGVFAEHYPEAVEFMERAGISFEPSNIGLVPEEPSRALGALQREYLDRGGEIRRGIVKKFLLDAEGEICGVAFEEDGTTRRMVAEQVILAAGGLTNLFEYTSGVSHDALPNVTALAFEAGLGTENLEFMMYHPFLVVDDDLPRTLVSGDIMEYAEFVTETGERFLDDRLRRALRNNRYHHMFDELSRAFYRQSQASDVYVDISDMARDEFERYRRENEYGGVFRGKRLEAVRRFRISPAFHYSLGGIETSPYGETDHDGVYAVGEIGTGLHGANRIGGTAIPEAVVFGRIAGERAANRVSGATPTVETAVGNSAISAELRRKVWRYLGPVKRRDDLEAFREELRALASPSSEEKLVREIVRSVLDREENVGAHYVVG